MQPLVSKAMEAFQVSSTVDLNICYVCCIGWQVQCRQHCGLVHTEPVVGAVLLLMSGTAQED